MKQRLDRTEIAKRAARELKSGDYVNLGFGMPNLVADYADPGVIFHTENGAIGYGPLVPSTDKESADFHYHDAIGRFWVPAPGMAIFDVLTSFAMIRGGRMTAILGGLQVSEKGDLANWNTGGPQGGIIGGAMDLAFGAKRVIVTMAHTTKDGKSRILKDCTLPLTSKGCVDLVVTDLAVMEVTPSGLLLKETAPGWTAADVQALTGAKLQVAPDLKEMVV
ncbi:MAG: succinyl-CoA--3-ketoacid-CoA transferase [Dehalococcoidia bacterium]|nr:succinyl-CoA--3-ketoacid-CoA transferase [Dehalococcoidia bacterium]